MRTICPARSVGIAARVPQLAAVTHASLAGEVLEDFRVVADHACTPVTTGRRMERVAS